MIMMPTDRCLTFIGPIRQPATNSFRVALLTMVNEGAERVTVLFSSDGGSTDEGLVLYEFLRALPLELTFHAIGHVGSIAIPVFLAADERYAVPEARFFFHEYSWTHPAAATVSQTTMEEQTLLLNASIGWTKRTIKARTKLKDGDFKTRKLLEKPVLLSAAEAADVGLVQAVKAVEISATSHPRIVM